MEQKKIGNNIVLMVNDRRLNYDTFWFTLLHEIGHIMHGDYGISFDKERGVLEDLANKYAEDMLIPKDKYNDFINSKSINTFTIKRFADEIDRDPGIVLGRLEKEGLVDYNDWRYKEL